MLAGGVGCVLGFIFIWDSGVLHWFGISCFGLAVVACFLALGLLCKNWRTWDSEIDTDTATLQWA